MKVGMIFQRKVWAINTCRFECLYIDEHRFIIQEIVLIQQYYPPMGTPLPGFRMGNGSHALTTSPHTKILVMRRNATRAP